VGAAVQKVPRGDTSACPAGRTPGASTTASLTYEAFGQTVAWSGSSSNPYRFAGAWGYRSDGDAGLMLVGARYYDAQVGRFISRDTYLDQNPYLYCDHDPVNAVDPSGHDGETLEFEVNLAQAIANHDVDQAGTLIEAVTDSDTAQPVEGTLREAFKQLPSKMSRSRGTWKHLKLLKNVYEHIKHRIGPDDPALRHHLKEVETWIVKFGKTIRIK